uniref:Secreted protein n=1 Tax=Strongyloides venezuelensis TaxID=75913 RepID=A0A0K0F441_STRVS
MKCYVLLFLIVGFFGNIYCTSGTFEVDEDLNNCIIEVPTVQQFKGNCIKLAFNAYGCAAGIHLDPFNRDCIKLQT